MSNAFDATYAALWVVVVVQGVLLIGVLKTLVAGNRPDSKVEVPAIETNLIGKLVPTFSGIDLDGNRVDQTSLPPSFNALLFISPDCVTCMASIEELGVLRQKVNGSLMVICRGEPADCHWIHEKYDLDGVAVVIDSDRKISNAFDVRMAPTAVLIGGNGRIRTYGHPLDKDELARMMSTAAGNDSSLEARV